VSSSGPRCPAPMPRGSREQGGADAKPLMRRAGLRPNGPTPARVFHSARGVGASSTRRGVMATGDATRPFSTVSREAQPHLVRDRGAEKSRPPDHAKPRGRRARGKSHTYTVAFTLRALGADAREALRCSAPPLFEIRLRIATVQGAVTPHTSIHLLSPTTLHIHTFMHCMPTDTSAICQRMRIGHPSPLPSLSALPTPALGVWVAASSSSGRARPIHFMFLLRFCLPPCPSLPGRSVLPWGRSLV
jgi:hypothetical protein